VSYAQSPITEEAPQDIVTGLDGVMFGDLMSNIEWFFKLHDKDQDGQLTKDELLQVSESLLVSLEYAFISHFVHDRSPSSYLGTSREMHI
jgi:hypothetical protein